MDTADLVLPLAVAHVHPILPPPKDDLSTVTYVTVSVDGQQTRIYHTHRNTKNPAKTPAAIRDAALDNYARVHGTHFSQLRYNVRSGYRFVPKVGICITPVPAEAVVEAALGDSAALLHRQQGRPLNMRPIHTKLANVPIMNDWVKFDAIQQQFRWAATNRVAMWFVCFNGMGFSAPQEAMRVMQSGLVSKMGDANIDVRITALKLVTPKERATDLQAIINIGKKIQNGAPAPAPAPRAVTGGKSSVPALRTQISPQLVDDVPFLAAPPVPVAPPQPAPQERCITSHYTLSTERLPTQPLPTAPPPVHVPEHESESESESEESEQECPAREGSVPPLQETRDPTAEMTDASWSESDEPEEECPAQEVHAPLPQETRDHTVEMTDAYDSSSDEQSDSYDPYEQPRYEQVTDRDPIIAAQNSVRLLQEARLKKMWSEGRTGTPIECGSGHVLMELAAQSEALEKQVDLADAQMASALRLVHALKRKRHVLRDIHTEVQTQIMLATAAGAAADATGATQKFNARWLTRLPAFLEEDPVVWASAQ